VLDRQIGKILTGHFSVIGDRKAALPHDAQPRLGSFVRQSILINLLRLPRTKRIKPGKRVADDTARQIIQRVHPILIRVRPSLPKLKANHYRSIDRSRAQPALEVTTADCSARPDAGDGRGARPLPNRPSSSSAKQIDTLPRVSTLAARSPD
jgi:hypothetical protein